MQNGHLRAVDRRVLLVDSSKFGITALIRLASFTECGLVITDRGIVESEAEMLRFCCKVCEKPRLGS
jgi:DeoR/GlpR family transcriptional regulator of sugar metabolism